MKQDGCNKIRCTKCNTIQCDVCRKTIKDYSHFNDTRRGGKTGQCPLFDESENRYMEEVSKVETEMRKKVVEENPEVVRATAERMMIYFHGISSPNTFYTSFSLMLS